MLVSWRIELQHLTRNVRRWQPALSLLFAATWRRLLILSSLTILQNQIWLDNFLNLILFMKFALSCVWLLNILSLRLILLSFESHYRI